MNPFVILGAAIAGVSFYFKSEITGAVERVETMGEWWTKFDPLFKKYAAVHGVEWTWLKAIALNESDLGRAPSVARGLASPSEIERSKSSDGLSWGVMQVTLKTAKWMDPLATEKKLNDPEYSINLAARYVAKLRLEFPRIEFRWLEWTIKSYNQGPGNTNKERLGQSSGFAHEYWLRFQRNLKRVEENQ